MKKLCIGTLLAFGMLGPVAPAAAQPGEFSVGVIGHAFRMPADESAMRDAIEETDADNLAFVVANGIKSSSEACSDNLYNRRKALLDDAKNGLILSLAASDWADCKSKNGKSTAIERLRLVRELFFSEDSSFGQSKIPLTRQSATPKFRAYGENTRWEFSDILFATINLPANNNHYLADAGRNSEFEDRLIANRNWLQRLFVFANRKNLKGIVLFSDGNPFAEAGTRSLFDSAGKRDGFAETRKLILAHAGKFQGKVLIVHHQPAANQAPSNSIAWRDNLGILEVGTGWTKFTIDPDLPLLFSTAHRAAIARGHQSHPTVAR